MDFNVIEQSDAIRLTFNAWPHSKLEATRCVLPLAAMYTPNKVLPNMPVSCGSVFRALFSLSLSFSRTCAHGVARASTGETSRGPVLSGCSRARS
jgi:hypothetical protein